MTNEDRGAARRALSDTLPVVAGYIVLGAGFGVLLSTRGYGALWALAMGLVVYSGSMQFVDLELMAGGASLPTTALTALMVSARHLFYGISMVDRYRGAGWRKPYLIYALTDETWSLACSAEDQPGFRRYCFLVSLFNHAAWLTGTTLGALLGPFIPFDTKGIDFALTALFVTLCVEQQLTARRRSPALVGLASSLVCLAIFGPDHFLIPTMLSISAALLLLRGRLEEDND